MAYMMLRDKRPLSKNAKNCAINFFGKCAKSADLRFMDQKLNNKSPPFPCEHRIEENATNRPPQSAGEIQYEKLYNNSTTASVEARPPGMSDSP
jgi:hypothetical protein